MHIFDDLRIRTGLDGWMIGLIFAASLLFILNWLMRPALLLAGNSLYSFTGGMLVINSGLVCVVARRSAVSAYILCAAAVATQFCFSILLVKLAQGSL
ncbi:hypothetical protein HY524_02070 [Candidatus Berkelbacteria bacterium]|nr:hypothetical protein [Candidatus Berkelbacteria bacterium]